MDPLILKIVLVIAFLILSLGIHEAAHAYVAHLCGDDTAKDMGRMTLNPIPHIDPFMTILMPAILYATTGFMFGGAKPVPVNYHNLRHPLRDMSLVALAGPLSNVLLAVLFLLVWKVLTYTVGMPADALAPQVMLNSVSFNLLLAAFNMIPIPPLDGSRVMAFLLPSDLRETYMRFERFGMLIVFGLLFSGVLWRIITPVINSGWALIFEFTGGVW